MKNYLIRNKPSLVLLSSTASLRGFQSPQPALIGVSRKHVVALRWEKSFKVIVSVPMHPTNLQPSRFFLSWAKFYPLKKITSRDLNPLPSDLLQSSAFFSDISFEQQFWWNDFTWLEQFQWVSFLDVMTYPKTLDSASLTNIIFDDWLCQLSLKVNWDLKPC